MSNGSPAATRKAKPRGGAPNGPDSKRTRRPSDSQPPTPERAPANTDHCAPEWKKLSVHGRCSRAASSTPTAVTAARRPMPATRNVSSEPSTRAKATMTARTTTKGTSSPTSASPRASAAAWPHHGRPGAGSPGTSSGPPRGTAKGATPMLRARVPSSHGAAA